MKPDNKDAENFKTEGFRRYITKKRSAIAAVVLLLIPIFITTVFLTNGNLMDQERSECMRDNMTSEVVTDYDGNKYSTVKIGNQYWMVENLRAVHYSNGVKIEEVYAYGNDESNVAKFGRLYTWDAIASPHGISPAGWHIPTEEEWQELERYIGMEQGEIEKLGWRGTQSESMKLKRDEKDLLWMDYSKRGVNDTGFSTLPGGVRKSGGAFFGKGMYADFWTSTEADSEKAWNRSLTWFPFHPGRTKIYRGNLGKSWGFSVRCIKDQ